MHAVIGTITFATSLSYGLYFDSAANVFIAGIMLPWLKEVYSTYRWGRWLRK